MLQKQKVHGMLLSELVLAILIVGILAVVVASQFRGAFDANAQALALYHTTQKMAANWNQVAATCGAKSDVIGSPLLAASNNTAADVLTRGETAVSSRFQRCYHQSNVRLLADAIQQTGSGQQIQGYRFDLSGGGMAPFVATFHAVPAELTYVLATRYGSLKTASLLPQDTSSLHVRYKPDGKNTYAVSILVGSPTQLAAAPTLIGTTPLGPPLPPGGPPRNPPVSPPVGPPGTLPLPPASPPVTPPNNPPSGGTTPSPCPVVASNANTNKANNGNGKGGLSLNGSGGGCATGGGNSTGNSSSVSSSGSGFGSAASNGNGNNTVAAGSSATTVINGNGNGSSNGSGYGNSNGNSAGSTSSSGNRPGQAK